MRPYIQSNPNTRICTTSATNAANCRTCLLDKSSVLVHSPSTVLLALHQRFRVGGSIRVKGSRMGTRFPTLLYRTVSLRTIPQSPCVTTPIMCSVHPPTLTQAPDLMGTWGVCWRDTDHVATKTSAQGVEAKEEKALT